MTVGVSDGEVAVRDHGPGIAPEDLPHVFDRFYRTPGARRMPGSGLGPAIVRQDAEADEGPLGRAREQRHEGTRAGENHRHERPGHAAARSGAASSTSRCTSSRT